MRKLGVFTLALLAYPLLAFTQEAENTAPQLPPSEVTPEQSVEAKGDLQKAILNTVVKASPKERKMMLEVIAAQNQILTQKENLRRPPKEQIEYKAPNINSKDRKEMQEYMQEVFVAPLSNTAAPIDENTEDTATNNTSLKEE